MSSLVQVRAVKSHQRGQRVGGVAADRCYMVDPGNGLLYPMVGKAVSAEPGVHPDDAAELLQFREDFAEPPAGLQIVDRSKAAPPRSPPPSGAAGPSGAPDPTAGQPAASDPYEAAWREACGDHNSRTTREWLGLAERCGLDLSVEDKQQKPKSKLAAFVLAKLVHLPFPPDPVLLAKDAPKE